MPHASWDSMALFFTFLFCVVVLLGAIKDR
jgi:hypothetical protein